MFDSEHQRRGQGGVDATSYRQNWDASGRSTGLLPHIGEQVGIACVESVNR